MGELLLGAYHALPPVLRSAAASVRGAYLRQWRYGRETDRLRDEALERESWAPERWRSWQETQLAFVLHRAATRVPFYRELWSERRRRGDRASWDLIGNWPLLEKEQLRANPRAFVADDCDRGAMFHDHTSGTTGKSLDVWQTKTTVRQWYALYEARCRSWYGISRSHRWAIFGGQLVASVARDKPPFWVWNSAMRQLYLSSYHLAPQHTVEYARALRRHSVEYVLGYPSALSALARSALTQGIELPRLRVALMNAEPLYDYQREEIGRAFCGTPVRETYGQSEIVAAASECPHGRMHLWPEVGWVEFERVDRGDRPAVAAEIVATSLINADMPLVRYRVGDRAALASASPLCQCGRTLPMLDHIEGRADDVLYSSSGSAVGRLDPVFKSRSAIEEAQIIQESLDRIRVRFVPSTGFSPADGASLTARIRERLGPVTVVLEEVDAIPRSPNGKFRAVICNLSSEERAWLVSR